VKTCASRILIVLLLLAGMNSPMQALACAVCYGESDAPMAKGAAFAILALGIVVAGVLGGIVAFFVHIKRKAAAQAATIASPDSV